LQFDRHKLLALIVRFREGIVWLNKNHASKDYMDSCSVFEKNVEIPLDKEWEKLSEAQRIGFLRHGPRMLP
jgi:hypothetical protein